MLSKPLLMAVLMLPLHAQEPTADDLKDLQNALDQPVQVASKRTQRLKEAPADLTVLRNQDLVDLGYRTLGEALGGVLGFRTNQDRAYTGLGVRGLYVLGDQNTRVLILLDGHALNSAAEVGSSKVGEDFGVPLEQVERIEIVRGPASSLYGNNAFLGMVNVVTRDPGPGALSGATGLTLATNGLAGLDGQLGGALGAVRWQAIVSGMDRRGTGTDFSELATGPLPASLDKESRQSAYLKVKGADWSVSGYLMNRTQGLSSAPFYSVAGSPDNRYENRLAFGEARATPTLGPVELLLRAFGDRNEFLSTFLYDGVRQPGTVGAYGESDPNWSLGLEAQARVRAGAGLLFTLGQEQTWQHYASVAGIGADLVDTQVRHQVGNSYFQAEWTPVDNLSAIAGVQAATWSVAAARSIVAGTILDYGTSTLRGTTPRLGLIWEPTSGDIVKLLYGGGYRNPTIFERFYTDLSTFLVNPALEAERITTLQGIWVRVWPMGLQSQLSASRSTWRNLVQPVDLGSGMQQSQNSTEPLTGTALEAELQGRWAGWSLYAQAGAYRWEQAGVAFPNATRFQGALRCTRHWGPWTLSSEVRQVGAREGGPGNPDAPAATVLRAAVRWQRSSPGRPGPWVRVTLEDAGQARRVDLVATDYAPMTRMAADGRTCYLTLGFPF